MERRQITYIHLAFWAYMVLQQVFPILTHAKLDPLYYKIVPLDLSFAVILFYILYRLVLPRLFRLKPKVITALGMLVVIVTYAAITLFLYYHYEKIFLHLTADELAVTRSDLLNHFRNNLVIGIYALLIRVVVDFLDHQAKEAEMKNQNQASEIAPAQVTNQPAFSIQHPE
jgi:hypothetical protein